MTNFVSTDLNIVLHAEPIFHLGSLKITNSMLLGWLISFILIISLISAARRIKVKASNHGVSIIEIICEGVTNLLEQVIHDRELALQFAPFIITLFVFILFNNWSGLIPGVGAITYHGAPLFRAWTSDLTGTLALSISSILIIQVYSFRKLKFKGVLTHYFSNKPWNPINFFVGLLEVLGEFTRIASLALRLFGNIFAGEVLLLVLASISGFGSPAATLPFIFMELFIGFIQAFVFTTLVIVYLTLAVSHHDEPESDSHIDHSPVNNPAPRPIAANGSPEKA